MPASPPAPAAPNAFAQHLAAALAAATALPEPLRWTLTVLQQVAERLAPHARPAPLCVPPGTAAEVTEAVDILSGLCATQLRGEDYAVAAVACFADAWIGRLPHARCADPACDPIAVVSLLDVAKHFKKDATLPVAAARSVGLSAAELAEKGMPLHTLSPSLLGRFYEMGKCHRYLHLRTDRGRLSNEAETKERDNNDAALEPLSRGASILRKGLLWEARLNVFIEKGGGMLCPPQLYGAGSGGGEGRAAPRQRLQLLDLTKVPYDFFCDCDFKVKGMGQRDASGRERQHGRKCKFGAELMKVSLTALFGNHPAEAVAVAQNAALVLYQAKFCVPDEAYASVKYGRINKADVTISNFQPDYVVLVRVDGVRTLVVVDAKSSGRVKQSHKVQVAFYCLMLQRFLRDEEARRGLEPGHLGMVARHGAVWRPPGPGDDPTTCSAPEVFTVTDSLAELERLIFKKLAGANNPAAVLSRAAYDTAYEGRKAGAVCAGQDWALQHSCAGCEFLSDCRAEAAASADPAMRLRGVSRAAADAARDVLDAMNIEDAPVGCLSGEAARLYRALDPATNSRLQEQLAQLPVAEVGARALAGALAVPFDASGIALDASPAYGAATAQAAAAAGVATLAASPKLVAAATSRACVRAAAVSPTFPCPPSPTEPADWAVFVALATEPITGELAGFCLQAVRLDTAETEEAAGAAAFQARPPVVVMADRDAYDEAALASAEPGAAPTPAPGGVQRSQIPTALVRELAAHFASLEGQRACVYVLEPWERGALLAALAAVALQPRASGERALAATAQRVLLAVLDGRALECCASSAEDGFEGGTGGTAYNVEKTSVEDAIAAGLPHLCTLHTEVGRLMELPAPGFATLEDTAAHVAPLGFGMHSGARAALELLLADEAAEAVASALVGLRAQRRADAPEVEALRLAVRAAGPDALYRDWSARNVGGVPRAMVLLARRCTLGALLLAGLRRALDDAGAGLEPSGVAHFAPNAAPLCRGVPDEAAPTFISPLAARAALFKRIEQASAAAKAREERTAPLATRIAKGRAALVTVRSVLTKTKDNAVSALLVVEYRQDASEPEKKLTKQLLTREPYKCMLVTPHNRAGALSALRFPDLAMAETTNTTGYSWHAACPKNSSGFALRQSLMLGLADITKPTEKELLLEAGKADTFKLTVPLLYWGKHHTALTLEHLAVGSQLVVFTRHTDNNSSIVASAVRSAVELPPVSSDYVWRRALLPGTEVMLHPQCSSSNAVAHVATVVKLLDAEDGSENHTIDVLVTNPEDKGATAPQQLNVLSSHVVCKFSLFRALLEEHGTTALQDCGVYFNGQAAGPSGGAQACFTVAGRWTFPDHDLLPCPVADAMALYRHMAPTASQESAFCQVLTHRLSTIWGPPGAGKTHWAVGSLLTLLRIHAERGWPFRVLVTAQSWEAITLLLDKLESWLKELSEAGEAWAARVVVTKKMNSDAALNDPACAWSAGRALCVYGGTVWQATKFFGPWNQKKPYGPRSNEHGEQLPAPKLQLVMIDEASQLPAADAALVLDLVDPHGGRVVAMGDHLQLPPVLQGIYPVPASDTGAPPPRPWCSLLDALRAAQACEPALAAPPADGEAPVTRAAEHLAACTLLDNHRMCETLASFCRAPDGIYPSDYAPCDAPACGDAAAACGCRTKPPGRQTLAACRGGAMRFNVQGQAALDWTAEVLKEEAKLVTVRVPAASVHAPPEHSEAALAATLLRAAAAAWVWDGVPPEPTTEAQRLLAFMTRVLVAAPHHRQIDDLKAELCAAQPALTELKINTVEKQQGQEANLVLILYGLTDATAVAGEASFLYSQARLNVSLTRARMKAVFFLTRVVEAPELDGGGQGAESVADGLALLQRVVRVCKAGERSKHEDDVAEPQRGARYVRIVAAAEDEDTQRSSLAAMLLDGDT